MCSVYFLLKICPIFFPDPRTLRNGEMLIIALATVSVMAVVAVAAFFGYRMMHGELPWCHSENKRDIEYYSRMFFLSDFLF